jgi:hypothetical protein
MVSLARKNSDMPIATGQTFSTRKADKFRDFYQRWNSPIFAFCLLASGDWEKAESLTEQAFAWYFRYADAAALHHSCQVPAALLRFAADLAELHCSKRSGTCEAGLAQALLTLPFKQRAVFIVVSALRVPPSLAAVALRLRAGQIAGHWTQAALRLRSSGFAQPGQTQPPFGARLLCLPSLSAMPGVERARRSS